MSKLSYKAFEEAMMEELDYTKPFVVFPTSYYEGQKFYALYKLLTS